MAINKRKRTRGYKNLVNCRNRCENNRNKSLSYSPARMLGECRGTSSKFQSCVSRLLAIFIVSIHLIASNGLIVSANLVTSSSTSVVAGENHHPHLIRIHKLHEIITQPSSVNSKFLDDGTKDSAQHHQASRILHISGSGFKTAYSASMPVTITSIASNNVDLMPLTTLMIKPTFSNRTCDYESNPLEIISKDEYNVILSLDKFDFGQATSAFLCVTDERDTNKLRHLGLSSKFGSPVRKSRSPRQDSVEKNTAGDSQLGGLSSNIKTGNSEKIFHINGLRVESAAKEFELEDGIPKLYINSEVILRLFGDGFTEHTAIAFTEESNAPGGSCLLPVTGLFRIDNSSRSIGSALFRVQLPLGSNDFYLCAKNDDVSTETNFRSVRPLIHQGSDSWLRLRSYKNFLPIWASIIIIVTCLIFSALFSGLNLGLMSLDRTELKILRNTGTDKERKYASQIQPVRDHGNYLLCSILLGNVLVNSTFTILLDGLTSGLIAVICSTLAIVIFGEITPQAICSRHGLAVGAKTIFITKAVMLITFPLAYPTSKILDCLLGEEIGNVYNRERLKELVRVTTGINDLDKDEVNIISGALELRKKTVGDVMTHIEDAFMLSLDAILDFETVSEIMKSGFSRIPVYDGDRTNIVTLLYIKDLAFVDPDDNTPLKTLCEFYQNPCHFVFEDVTLDIMFKQFKEGHKGHMAFVHRVNSEGDGDPFYETIGLVTLEDVIEELIQAEIMDETDVFTDNRKKVKRLKTKKQDFTVFAERRENQRIRISPQLTLATFQYLSTSIDAFRPDVISETILRRMLNQDIIHHIKCKGKDKNDPSIIIYQQGKPVDFFVLILEGRVEVTVGRENLVFESGPFTFFGTQALVQNVGVVDSPNQAPAMQVMGSIQSLNMDALLRHTFVPDYSVRSVTDVIYLAIKRTLYLAAKRATLMERSQKVEESGSEPIDYEVEKLLYSLDEDDRSIGAHTANLNTNTPKNGHSKPSSNSPSPTFPSSEIILNGPGALNQNSYSSAFNPQSTTSATQRSNSLANPNAMSAFQGYGTEWAGSVSSERPGDADAIADGSESGDGFIGRPSSNSQSTAAVASLSSTKDSEQQDQPADTPLLPRSKS